ncbi:recombinase family protein [Clostridium magnum]|uniref:Recombinase n=1 Tax=Clostridium magnum DSM 2767 TaxID=1121326 RepID=A0A161YTA1_9CLOT|nr:recombinase family protein [Clostridium magnum]KZL94322.1 recombinase [Clostridium magnum DSM 2767]SHJ55071.1 Site-specific DNA recombinase [Clostridium magnum DSM 2767]
MDKVCIYLRKSRADEELEKTLGEGETLSKHKKALLKFAKEKKLNIVEIKEEIVSGESLFFRPKMLELLKEVEAKQYNGVLVMDMQRLGRGDMQDQGIILKTFKDAHTKIITPQKTYDLDNDFDEEYSEFEAFMSRKELKMINRRMQGGRVRSVEDGNYIATNAPLGYDIHWINKCRTLKINEPESEVVKLIFKMYCDGSGAGNIASYLNSLGYKTKFSNTFSSSSVLAILKNPIYIGKVSWKKKEIKKSRTPNKVKDTRTRDKSEWIVVDGKHEAIISDDVFQRAQEILGNKYHVPYQIVNGPSNPLAGLIICSKCKSKMMLRNLRGIGRILCNSKCGNKSVRFDYLEKAILDGLEEYLKNYKVSIKNNPKSSNIEVYKNQLDTLNNELQTLADQKLRLFDLLERRIYDEATFLDRSQNLDERINKIMAGISSLKKIIETENKSVNKNDVVKFENIIDAYKMTEDIQKKNNLMKSILIKVEYNKDADQKNDDFEIQVFPKLLR